MIGPALDHSAKLIGSKVRYSWVTSESITEAQVLSSNGLFIGPGGPSEDIKGIVRAIQIARTQEVPCLGTCGGLQRIVAEYATHELGFEKIEHQENSPDAVDPLFSALQCSLVGDEAEVIVEADTLAAEIYGCETVRESFFCGYGINEQYFDQLQSRDMKASAFDHQGELRIVELKGHPFLMGTLFVPQVRSTEEDPHPIVTAFLSAAKKHAEQNAARYYVR